MNMNRLYPLVKAANNFHYHPSLPLIPLTLSSRSSHPIGFLRPSVASAIFEDHQSQTNSPWSISPCTFSFAPHVQSQDHRTFHLSRLVNSWKQSGRFPTILKGWSNESYPVYLPADAETTSSTSLSLTIERAALPLFGFPNFGAFLIAYYICPQSQTYKIWVPRRSWSKKTFPGLLDVTAGGGMAVGESPLQAIIREAAEEAHLPSTYLQQNIRSTGCVTFSNRNPAGWILPGFYYTYDLPLPSDHSIRPKINPSDGEVDNFELLEAEDCFHKLLAGEFKPSSALAIIDFFTRHGLYTPSMDTSFASVMQALRRDLTLPMPR